MPRKCSYFQCNVKHGEKSMFRFPIDNERRLQAWIEHCGNMTITQLPREALQNKYICIEHFGKECFISEKRQRLKKTAVPIHFQGYQSISPEPPVASTSQVSQGHESPDLKVLTPNKTYSGVKRRKENSEDSEEEEVNLYTSPKKRKRLNYEDTPKCKKLKSVLERTKKLLKKERNKNSRLMKKLESKKNIYKITANFKSEASQILANMQLRKNKQPWTEEEKKFCLSLFYKSPAAYNHLRSQGIKLAAPTTIQHWLQATNCLPGLNEDIFQNIKIKFADQSIKDKSCVVCFDEMSIKVDLDYTMKFDLIEGFEDFGDGDRSPKEAKYALVFVARGIYNNWKIPLAYFLSNKTVHANKLIELIKSVINKLFDCGLLPKAVICDQATTNVKAIKSLGATVDDPFFFIDNRKLYAIFDVPHLIKNVRNNLIDNNFDLNGNEISFKDIIDVYNIDRNNKSKTLRKLTPVHLNPNNFQKMKVKYATQVLSHSVGAAIITAMDSGELKSDTGRNTADFVINVNNLFDSLNSKNKYDRNPFKCALTNDNQSHVHEILIKGKNLFADLKKKMIAKNKSIKLTCPPCFEGMQQTINSVLQLANEEFSKGTGVHFLMTNRLNQDVIENLFGIYRIKGGCNRNPTSKSLRAMFRSNLLNNLIKLENTNCEVDNDTFLSTTTSQQTTQPTQPSEVPQTASSNSTNRVESEETVSGPSNAENIAEPTSTTEITLETCSVVYFAGWLGKVCIEKFDCLMCKQLLIKDEVDLMDKRELLLINKTYSNLINPTLKSPTDFLEKLVDRLLAIFNDRIDYMHEINLITNLMANVSDPDDYHDKNHLEFLIKKLFKVKIYDYCKSRKSSFDSRSKTRILQHK